MTARHSTAAPMAKGAQTRERILERAFLLAGRDGLAGLTIGALADDLGLSKSGLFAHFGSKEELQVAVLEVAASRFTERVVLPAFKAPRGLPRVEALFQNWVAWGTDPRLPGGCPFAQAVVELDDREGPPRDTLVEQQQGLRDALAKAIRLAVEARHLRADTDPEQMAFEMHGIILSMYQELRLFRSPRSVERARAAFRRLVKNHTP